MSGHRLRSFGAAFAIVLSACAGPQTPLDVGMREVASDITIGAPRLTPQAAPAPVPPTAVVVDLPVPSGQPARPRFGPSPDPTPGTPQPSPTPAPTCPTADPLSSPAVSAPHDRALPPVEAAYAYANDGSFSVSGANANEGTFDEPSTRTVQNVRADDPARGFTYEVAASLSGTVTTTTYEVRNAPTVDDPTGAGAQANLDDDRGLYLASVRTQGPDGSTSTFRPASALLLMPFPAFPDAAWDATGTDATTGTTMSFHGRVVGRADVDACGQFVDAFRIELTSGRVIGPLTNVQFAATYDLATQYGGLSVHDLVHLAGTEGLNTLERTNESTIRQVPQSPPS